MIIDPMEDKKMCPDCAQVVVWDWYARCSDCAHITDNCDDDCHSCKMEGLNEE